MRKAPRTYRVAVRGEFHYPPEVGSVLEAEIEIRAKNVTIGRHSRKIKVVEVPLPKYQNTFPRFTVALFGKVVTISKNEISQEWIGWA